MGKAALILLCLLAGCATPKSAIRDGRALWCEFNEPRQPSPEVVRAMTRPELDKMNAFNAQGVAWCGWSP